MVRYISEEPGLRTYVEEVERFPVLDREGELELARRWRHTGDTDARRQLIEGHLRSVVRLATKYRGYGIYISELVAEGNLGLIEAVKRFEPERGLRFLTYARYWVRAYILSYVLKHWSIVDMGNTAMQSKMFFRLQAEHSRLSTELGETDDSIDSRLADKFQVSEDDVRTSMMRLTRRDASLNAPLPNSAQTTHLDLLCDDREDQESRFASAELSTMVYAALEEVWPLLDVRERLIVKSRLLPRNDDATTLAALGRQLGVTRERVRQLEVGIKQKLKTVFTRLNAIELIQDRGSEAAAA